MPLVAHRPICRVSLYWMSLCPKVVAPAQQVNWVDMNGMSDWLTDWLMTLLELGQLRIQISNRKEGQCSNHFVSRACNKLDRSSKKTQTPREWKRINRKQSDRWQHLSRLKASAFFSLQKKLVSCMKRNSLCSWLVTPSSGWWTPIGLDWVLFSNICNYGLLVATTLAYSIEE